MYGPSGVRSDRQHRRRGRAAGILTSRSSRGHRGRRAGPCPHGFPLCWLTHARDRRKTSTNGSSEFQSAGPLRLMPSRWFAFAFASPSATGAKPGPANDGAGLAVWASVQRNARHKARCKSGYHRWPANCQIGQEHGLELLTVRCPLPTAHKLASFRRIVVHRHTQALREERGRIMRGRIIR